VLAEGLVEREDSKSIEGLIREEERVESSDDEEEEYGEVALEISLRYYEALS
jgi:hypothetical protein